MRIVEKIASVGDTTNYLFRFNRLLIPSSKAISIEDMVYLFWRIIKRAVIEVLKLLLAWL